MSMVHTQHNNEHDAHGNHAVHNPVLVVFLTSSNEHGARGNRDVHTSLHVACRSPSFTPHCMWCVVRRRSKQADAVVVREFNIVTKTFVEENAFHVPEVMRLLRLCRFGALRGEGFGSYTAPFLILPSFLLHFVLYAKTS